MMRIRSSQPFQTGSEFFFKVRIPIKFFSNTTESLLYLLEIKQLKLETNIFLGGLFSMFLGVRISYCNYCTDCTHTVSVCSKSRSVNVHCSVCTVLYNVRSEANFLYART